MRFLPATIDMYRNELSKYFKRLSPDELMFKSPNEPIMYKYLKNARYEVPRNIRAPFNINMDVYFVINKDIEYNCPHTLGAIIIIPEDTDANDVIAHELLHVYFRNISRQVIFDFCKAKNIKAIIRPRMPREITNPDTNYNTCLLYGKGALFVALIDLTRFFIKNYYYTDFKGIRFATPEEIRYYNLVLPYEQNEHPEEMMAEMLSERLKK